MSERIGIVAGSGQYPFLVAQGAKKQGMQVYISGFTGNTDPAIAAEAEKFTMLNLGQLGHLIDFFKKNKVSKVCMAGAVSKPKALSLRPDFRAARVLFKLATHKGDDSLLRAVAAEFSSEGIAVIQPVDLVPELRSPAGIISSTAPSVEVMADVKFGWKVAKSIGKLDIGQCVAVLSGIVVAVEAIEGTDALISRAGSLAGAGCTLVKTSKPGQDERIDSPAVGHETLSRLAENKFVCLAYEAGKTLFFNQTESLQIARKNNISIIGLESDFATDVD